MLKVLLDPKEGKLIYLDFEVLIVNTTLTHLNRDRDEVTYIIDKDIIDVIIGEISMRSRRY